MTRAHHVPARIAGKARHGSVYYQDAPQHAGPQLHFGAAPARADVELRADELYSKCGKDPTELYSRRLAAAPADAPADALHQTGPVARIRARSTARSTKDTSLSQSAFSRASIKDMARRSMGSCKERMRRESSNERARRDTPQATAESGKPSLGARTFAATAARCEPNVSRADLLLGAMQLDIEPSESFCREVSSAKTSASLKEESSQQPRSRRRGSSIMSAACRMPSKRSTSSCRSLHEAVKEYKQSQQSMPLSKLRDKRNKSSKGLSEPSGLDAVRESRALEASVHRSTQAASDDSLRFNSAEFEARLGGYCVGSTTPGLPAFARVAGLRSESPSISSRSSTCRQTERTRTTAARKSRKTDCVESYSSGERDERKIDGRKSGCLSETSAPFGGSSRLDLRRNPAPHREGRKVTHFEMRLPSEASDSLPQSSASKRATRFEMSLPTCDSCENLLEDTSIVLRMHDKYVPEDSCSVRSASAGAGSAGSASAPREDASSGREPDGQLSDHLPSPSASVRPDASLLPSLSPGMRSPVQQQSPPSARNLSRACSMLSHGSSCHAANLGIIKRGTGLAAQWQASLDVELDATAPTNRQFESVRL